MTVWADDVEKESALFSNVQVEVGCDSTDLWLSFNKSTTAVQFTHAEAVKLIADMQNAIRDATAVAFDADDIGKPVEEGVDR